MGWLPIVNHTGAKGGGGGWLIIVDISYTTLHKRTAWGRGVASHVPHPPGSPPGSAPVHYPLVCVFERGLHGNDNYLFSPNCKWRLQYMPFMVA